MPSMQYENVSPDLIWECVNGRGAQLVKTKISGGLQFSRDPYNLTNKHSRKHEGFVNPTAISIQPPHPSSDNPKGVIVATKKADSAHRPAKSQHVTTHGASTPSRRIYKSIASQTAKRGYRADLRYEAIARASAIRNSMNEKKTRKSSKPRGKAAKRKAEEDA